MNIALIFAGGTGDRMNSNALPKQFLDLYGKPIIIHTLEHFENHLKIDYICIVCLSSWVSKLKQMLKKYNINKVQWIEKGGKTGQQSIYNGLQAIFANSEISKDSIVLIHDGVRPLINENLISNCISTTQKNGSAITTSPIHETIVIKNKGNLDITANRDHYRFARAPQCFKLADIYAAHQMALADNLDNFVDSASLMRHYGYELFMVEGAEENIKITTAIDYYMFRAIYEARENLQIFGL